MAGYKSPFAGIFSDKASKGQSGGYTSPFSGVFDVTEEQVKRREEEELAKLAAKEQAKKQKEGEKKGRGTFSKIWDQVNVLDSGRDWSREAPSKEGAAKSAFQQGKETGSALFSGLEKVGDSVEALTGIAEIRVKHWDKQLKEGKITRGQYQTLLQKQLADTEWAGSEDKGTGDRLKTAAGVSLEATSEIVPFLKAGKAAQLTVKGGTKLGAGAGLAHGTGSQLNNPEGFDPKAVVLETVLGGGGGALGGWLAQRAAAKRAIALAVPEDVPTPSQTAGAITDPARLLPDGSQSRAARLAEIDDELDNIRKNPNYEPPKSKELGEYSKVGDKPEAQLTAGKTKTDGELDQRFKESKTAAVTAPGKALQLNSKASRARELIRERDQVIKEIEEIKNPVNKIAEEITLVDDELAKAQRTGNTGQVKRSTKQQAFLADDAAKIDKELEIDTMLQGNRQEKVSKVASRTEALAIREKLGGFDELPTYQTTNLADEADVVIEHMNTDMDSAVRVAMGIDAPPPGASPESFYVGVTNRAAKSGDAPLIKRLGMESSISKGASRMGQRISALQNLDPESPVTAIKQVLEARKVAAPKVPATISDAEAEQISLLSKGVLDTKDAIAAGGDPKAYGAARVEYDNYVKELIGNARPSLKESVKKAGFYKDAAVKGAGLTKSLVATLDNSVIGRQGWKTMMTHPKTWAKNSLKSFQDIAKTFKGQEVMDHVHADVVSRDNALNGMYKAMGIDVYGAKKDFIEEAFPVKLGNHWKKGNPLKASNVAFDAWQQRTRADLADQYLVIAKKMGVDLTDPKKLKAIGKMVNSLTSRGNLPKNGERIAGTLNNVFFSPRLFKSNIDVLGGHMVSGAGEGFKFTLSRSENFVRRRAARNLIRIAVGSAMALKLASEVTGGKIEANSRSSNFGKVQIGATRFDLTGGMAGLVTLGSRFITDSTKSSQTGEVTKLNSGEFGARTTIDVVSDFAENKLSPAFKSAVDWKKGKDFDGNKPTIGSTVRNLTVPLIIQQYSELKDNPDAANITASMIFEGLGVSVNTYSMDSNWNANNGKKITGFKNTVSKSSFEKANKDFDNNFNDWYAQVSENETFWKLPVEQRERIVTKKKNNLTAETMAAYGYKYKIDRKKDDTEKLADSLLKLYK